MIAPTPLRLTGIPIIILLAFAAGCTSLQTAEESVAESSTEDSNPLADPTNLTEQTDPAALDPASSEIPFADPARIELDTTPEQISSQPSTETETETTESDESGLESTSTGSEGTDESVSDASIAETGADSNSIAESEKHTGLDQTGVVDIDLWSRLRRGFSLGNLENSPKLRLQFEDWYARHPKYFERLAKRAYWFLPHILEEVENAGMPSEVALLPAIESAFRPDATSRSKAAGIWQFISATGRRFGLRQDWWMDGRRDLIRSTDAALQYLTYLRDEFNGDWELAFAAYNAGEGNIRRAIRQNKATGRSTRYSDLDLRKETTEYVPKLFAVRNIIDNPEKYGINLKSIPNTTTLAALEVPSQTDLTVVASLAGISSSELHFLNSAYKRGVTPPDGPHTILLPFEQFEDTKSKLFAMDPVDRVRWARHRVRKGEFIGRIARKHGVSVDAIKRANSLSSNLIHPGQLLRIPLSRGRFEFASNSSDSVVARDSDTIYKVRPGDTLWELARRFNVSINNLMIWNGLTKKSILNLGQQLIVNR
ncbi:MAG: LysM peptidoglycan-binding domain-containing protein [Pseudomonadota bacterium]